MVQRVSPAISHLLRYWRDIEFFLPFDLEDVYERYAQVYELKFNLPMPMPWEDLEHYQLDCEREYGFDLFIAPFTMQSAIEALSEKLPQVSREIWPDSRNLQGLSCFARVAVSSSGTLITENPSFSTLPWALHNWSGINSLLLRDFDCFCGELLTHLSKTLTSDEEEEEDEISVGQEIPPLSFADLQDFAHRLTEGHRLKFFPNSIFAVLVPHRLGKKKLRIAAQTKDGLVHVDLPDKTSQTVDEQLRKKRKVDILNSFYLRDLEKAKDYLNHPQEQSALLRFLAEPRPVSELVDVFDESNRYLVLDRLGVENLPCGRWPAPVEQIPALQQQLALNSYLAGDERVFAVNGPPGTGKTTLVRDLLAHLVVSRALRLAKLPRPADAFADGAHEIFVGPRKYRFRKLLSELCGFELFVVSNNNAAVENISLELPKAAALGAEYCSFGYLTPIARLYHMILNEKIKGGEEADLKKVWGLPSAALGNSRNRRLFRRAAFLYPSEETEEQTAERLAKGELLTLFEWRRKSLPGPISFHQAKQKVQEAKQRFESWREQKLHSATAVNLSAIEVRSRNWQFQSPWIDEEGNTLRNELFLAALQLHEAWVREVPNFEQEMFSLSLLLRNPSCLGKEDAVAIWRLFFMIIPVVSSTLASVERMCASLPPGSIGNVVIEEAGQATPQSAVGILMRAKSALIIGDQRQLEPVVTIPDALEQRLAVGLDPILHRRFCPLYKSVQTVADELNRFGTRLWEDSGSWVWLGCPLCLNRRSCSPMFEIANSIAYNGMMIQAVECEPPKGLLGASCWFQATGNAITKQWVPEQGRIALELLMRFIAGEDRLPDIFFISPFREVRTQLKVLFRRELDRARIKPEDIREIMKRIGTVHTFQGKEAETVVMVLGCDFQTSAAANWAGEKPNLLNVALTRARKFFYVIADADLWHNKGYFSDLEKTLTKKNWV